MQVRRTLAKRLSLARVLRLSFAVSLLFVTFFCTRDAHAYTWMIRHDYGGCTPCHRDPSGGGILTPYGRAVGGLLLSTRYAAPATDEADPTDEFLFGAVPLPDEIMLGGDGRLMWYASKVEGVETQYDSFLMQADLEAAVNVHHVLASGSIGYAEQGALNAAITNENEQNLVSRVHWLGYEFDETTSLVLRAGRMNLPFGIRNVEHTSWVRDETDTSVNADQQHGIAVAWAPAHFRGELMAILGNYQIHPDQYRERGGSGYLEWQPFAKLALGASALVTHRDTDPVTLKETWRHAYGLFGRWATGWEPLVVLAEADYVLRSSKQDFHRSGIVALAQADVEMIQGVHFLVTGEAKDVGIDGTPFSYGIWISQAWFLAPHLDLRVDSTYQNLGDEFGRTDVLTLIAQAHMYL
jgi:hypothetical protein